MASLTRIRELSAEHPFFEQTTQPQKGTDLWRARLDHLLEQQPAGIARSNERQTCPRAATQRAINEAQSSHQTSGVVAGAKLKQNTAGESPGDD